MHRDGACTHATEEDGAAYQWLLVHFQETIAGQAEVGQLQVSIVVDEEIVGLGSAVMARFSIERVRHTFRSL